MPIRGRECKACGHRYEIFSMGPTRVFVLDQAPAYKGQLVCPACGSEEAHAMIPPRVHVRGSSSMGCVTYPYFDRGLGRQVNSPAHRMQICAELGVTPTDGESIGTWGDIAEKNASKEAADQAKLDAYVDEMETTVPGEWAAVKAHAQRSVQEQVNNTVGNVGDTVHVVGD